MKRVRQMPNFWWDEKERRHKSDGKMILEINDIESEGLCKVLMKNHRESFDHFVRESFDDQRNAIIFESTVKIDGKNVGTEFYIYYMDNYENI